MPPPRDLDTPVPKSFYGGTHRVTAPEATLARVRPLMPVLGITRIANVTGLDSVGIPVVMVCRPNARSLAVAQGKGLDLPAAQASGLMESVEAYHAESITLPLKLASYAELRYTHRLVEVELLPRPRDSLFHARLPILWIEGYDILQHEPVWVPYEMVHTNYTVAMQSTLGSFVASSNGLASGNHRLEAISHGICELVERDAATYWLTLPPDEQARTQIDLATVQDAACRSVLDKYARAGIAVAVWEVTRDIGISVFFCRIMEQAADPLRRLYAGAGLGCHPVRAIALLRALTEAAQSRLTLIAGARDDAGRRNYDLAGAPDFLQEQRAQADAPPQRAFAAGPDWQADTVDADVRWELERLRAVGIARVIVVDLTKPEFGLPVVRVVIPGLASLAGDHGYIPVRRAAAGPGPG